MPRILFYGDSNTWGFNADTGTRFPDEISYVGRLRGQLPPAFHLISEGLCGRTTAFGLPLEPGRNGLDYLPVALASADPLDLVVIMLGTNDRRVSPRITPQESALAMERCIATIRSPALWGGHRTPQILLLSPVPLSPTVLDTPCAFYYSEQTVRDSLEVSACYEETARRCGCHFLSLNSVAEPGWDGVHLNEDGHRALADALAQKLSALFPEEFEA